MKKTALALLLAASILAACTPYSPGLSRKHGIDGGKYTPRELSTCYKAAYSYMKQETGDSIKFIIVANSGLADRITVIDTAHPDTIKYREMWFLVRIDNDDLSSSGVELALYFTPDLEHYTDSKQQYIDNIMAAR